MDELERVRDASSPTNALLVLDAMTGQQAVEVATAFQERIDFDGVILTKLDGDARGGAALSVKSVTGRPIMFASTGEKLDALEVFHPDRMASRILGMGDVLTLIERAEQATSEDEAARMEAQMRKGQFTFDDFLPAQKMLRRMGPLQGILKMMPGMGQLADADVDENRLKRVEAIVLSMTPRERAIPHSIDGHRRRPDRRRLRHHRPGGEPAPRGAEDDGEDDGPDGQGQDARAARPRRLADGRCDARRRRPASPRSRAARRRRNGRATRGGRVVGNLSAWQSSSGSPVWAPRRTRSTASSRPTRAPPVTGSSSRSSAATTRRPIPRRSTSTTRRSRAGSSKGAQPTEAVARLIKVRATSRDASS